MLLKNNQPNPGYDAQHTTATFWLHTARQPNEVIPTQIHKIYGSHSFTCVCDQDEQVWNFCDGPDGSHSCAVAMLSISSSERAYLSHTAHSVVQFFPFVEEDDIYLYSEYRLK